jgi:AcrR family transcriptional regulator
VTASARPLRRDAERNRQLLLSTARVLMAERGLDVTHDEVAREAGVGVGTVYRRFPARQDLVDAVFDEHIDEVVAIAEQACTCVDAWEGLEVFMERHLELQAEDRGLSELLRGRGPDSELVRRARERITPIVDGLVERARGAGQVGPDVGAGDFVLVQLMVCGVMDAARSVDPRLWRRALVVALAGLRHHQPLPGDPPDGDTVERLHTSAGHARLRHAGGAP